MKIKHQLKKENLGTEIIRAQRNYPEMARYVKSIYDSNIAALHGCEISEEEFNDMLCSNDIDEENYLIVLNNTPIAWLKLNGLLNSSCGWISMLAVLPNMHRKGIGKWAIEFAERRFKQLEKKQILLKTTKDNLKAQSFYISNGFKIKESIVYKTSDGIKHDGYIFKKQIS